MTIPRTRVCVLHVRVTDYWVGMYETAAGIFQWAATCQPVSYHVANNYNMTSTTGNQFCFAHSPALLHRGLRYKCAEPLPFLCQRFTCNHS